MSNSLNLIFGHSIRNACCRVAPLTEILIRINTFNVHDPSFAESGWLVSTRDFSCGWVVHKPNLWR